MPPDKLLEVDLLIIDPQVDFCDPNGALYVKGAEQDMRRLGALIKRVGGRLRDIHVTLDSHHLYHIAHPTYWINSAGEHPKPGTIITAEDTRQGRWMTFAVSRRQWGKDYTAALEANGRYALYIWPPHCIIATPGYAIHPSVLPALHDWERRYGPVDLVTKGSNYHTENYSAVKAEVPDPDDPTTGLNIPLITVLDEADIIPVAGEAADFCIANTLRDIIEEFGAESAKKLVLLTDCMSAVNAPGLEHLAKGFFDEMRNLGVRMMDSTEFMKGA